MGKRAAVGGALGFISGFAVKKSQDMIIYTCMVGGVAVAGACYMGWVTPDELVDKSSAALEESSSYFGQFFASAAEEVPKKLKKSKVVLSNVAKRLPGLAGGFVAGTLVGLKVG